MLMDKQLLVRVAVVSAALGALSALPARGQGVATITLDPGTTYQTFTGWEVTDFFGEPGYEPWPHFADYRDQLFDKIVNDYGATRIRLELPAGTENPVDYFAQYEAGDITQYRYVHCFCRAPRNDDGDPLHIDPDGFQFHQLDWKLDNSVVPLRRLVTANGEALVINLALVSFDWSASECPDMPYETGWLQYNFPEEYAELIQATFSHMETVYGFVPDTVQVMLEPDNTAFSGAKMGQAMLATEERLSQDGFHPKFVVPSTTSMAHAVPYFEAIRAVVGDDFIRQHVQEISYHRYGGVSDNNLAASASTSVSFGIGAAMLEWWGASTYQTLYQDLTAGRNTAWQEGTILGIYKVTVADGQPPVVAIADKSRYVRQYTRYIRPGAVRIKADSSESAVGPVAFVNADGRTVVVMKTGVGRTFTIRGLPPGTYGIKYTTEAEYDVDLPDEAVGADRTLATAIPAPGVISIFSRARAAPAPTPGYTGSYLPVLAR
jgi:hypothetical protein